MDARRLERTPRAIAENVGFDLASGAAFQRASILVARAPWVQADMLLNRVENPEGINWLGGPNRRMKQRTPDPNWK